MNGKKTDKPFTFNRTVIGASHIKHKKPCQDFSFSAFNPENFKKSKKQYAIAIVADGHGSSDYFRSDRGSRMACEVARESVRLLMQDSENGINNNRGSKLLLDNPDYYMGKLKKTIITLWRDMVAKDFADNPFTDEEMNSMSDKGRAKYEENPHLRYVNAYGTTLILVLKHSLFWFGLQIGDGKCVACYPKAEFVQPIPWDDKCFLNVTTSLCDEDAFERFRHSFHTDTFPDAIYIATDGVDDSFGTDERLNGFYEKLTLSFMEKGTEKTVQELEYFLPQLSEKGSGDDISIAGIVNH